MSEGAGSLKIILASASPRRRELLTQIGLAFEVKISNVPEKITAREPWAVVEELSRQKAEAVLETLEEQGPVLVIGADTVVALEDRILGKPADGQDAMEMLGSLSGTAHDVYTGVTLLYRPGAGCEAGEDHRTGENDRTRTDCQIDEVMGAEMAVDGTAGIPVERKTFHERTKVRFYPATEEEIAFYVAQGDCMDKAGAYGIQGLWARHVQGIEGDYNNVVGLPVGRLYQEAREWLELEEGSDF